jgi:hypothetical protein
MYRVNEPFESSLQLASSAPSNGHILASSKPFWPAIAAKQNFSEESPLPPEDLLATTQRIVHQ